MTRDNETIELKPCPFCGTDDLATRRNGAAKEYVQCQNCGCEARKDIWNTRADRQAPQVDVEGLKREVAIEICGGFDVSLSCDACEAISDTIHHL